MNDYKNFFWWFSFRNPDTNTNLGVCEVQADNKEEALSKTLELGINPGGEVLIFPLTEPELPEQNKLYSREDMVKMGYQAGI